MRIGRFDARVLAAVSQAPTVAKQVRRTAAMVRVEARKGAPVRTGAGRRSIQVRRVTDRATKLVGFRVSWDRDHFYMGFQNGGAKLPNGGRIRAQQFLQDAAEKVNRR